MTHYLGKLPPRFDNRTLQLQKYLPKKLPTQPESRLWQTAVTDWGVAGNDRFGNCVIATAAHAILNWRANETGDARKIADAAVIELSRSMGALDGYAILDRLNYWRKTGMWANYLWAYASIPPDSQNHIEITINEFGLADVGLNMPRAWQNREIWDTGTGPRYRTGSWGGHSVPLVGYDHFCVYAITWGGIKKISWPGLATYCDEAYALINPTWIEKQETSPSGYDLTSLHDDLKQVTTDE